MVNVDQQDLLVIVVSLAHQAPLEREDLLDLVVCLENVEREDQQGRQDNLESKDQLGPLDQLDLQDQLVREGQQDLPANLASQVYVVVMANLAPLDHLDRLGSLVNEENGDLLDHLDPQAHKVKEESLDGQVKQGTEEKEVNPVWLDNLDLQDLKENVVRQDDQATQAPVDSQDHKDPLDH